VSSVEFALTVTIVIDRQLACFYRTNIRWVRVWILLLLCAHLSFSSSSSILHFSSVRLCRSINVLETISINCHVRSLSTVTSQPFLSLVVYCLWKISSELDMTKDNGRNRWHTVTIHFVGQRTRRIPIKLSSENNRLWTDVIAMLIVHSIVVSHEIQ
jgi:hypothetical protein